MLKRREFLKKTMSSAAVGIIAPSLFKQQSFAAAAPPISDTGLSFSSPSIEAQLSNSAPEFARLNIDSLGKRKRGVNVFDITNAATGYRATAFSSGGLNRVEYRSLRQDGFGTPAWTVEMSERKIRLISQWSEDAAPEPFLFRFNLSICHSTVLGLFEKDKTLSIPALIHCPGQGSMRITADATHDIGLTYQSQYKSTLATLGFPAATQDRKRIVHTLEVVAIYPELKGIEHDERFDPFRRNWLNVLQLSPSNGVLSNNTASDSCALCYYEYGDIASLTPPLAEGLTALDIVRQTLDYILAGGTTYGQPALGDYPAKSAYPVPSSDTLPSLLIAAADCVRAGRSDAWLSANYKGIQNWADTMLATDKNGNGLIEYIVSGNSGTWLNGTPPKTRPANWWDTIGTGHEDAYSNALTYRALGDMEMMAERVGKPADAARYRAAALKLHDAYFKTFYDPATGVLGGWRSADGQLHGYYFLWVNGIAIHYGLVPKHEANAIMDKLMAKMKAVGYDKFNMGLPGNLISVPLKDYVEQSGKVYWGGGVRADNADGFQNYENGGATGCFVFWTLAALYDLGRKEEADRILFAMLEEYGRGGFEGRGPNGRSNDWRRWDGTPMGYEGFLSDNYYTLLAVPLRQNEISWREGYRAETSLS
jgi:hypothetical protein